jgi:hypothetical protein
MSIFSGLGVRKSVSFNQNMCTFCEISITETVLWHLDNVLCTIRLVSCSVKQLVNVNISFCLDLTLDISVNWITSQISVLMSWLWLSFIRRVSHIYFSTIIHWACWLKRLASDSYCGGSRFEYRPKYRSSWPKFQGFSQFLRTNRRILTEIRLRLLFSTLF